MPQLETSHILLDTFLMTSCSFFGFFLACYTTCTTADHYYTIISKYIIHIHCSLHNYIKTK